MWAIYIFPRLVYHIQYFPAAKYINRSQIYECRNFDWCRTVSFLEHFVPIFGPMSLQCISEDKQIFLIYTLKTKIKFNLFSFLMGITLFDFLWTVGPRGKFLQNNRGPGFSVCGRTGQVRAKKQNDKILFYRNYPTFLYSHQKIFWDFIVLKGLSHELDVKKFDKNLKYLA